MSIPEWPVKNPHEDAWDRLCDAMTIAKLRELLEESEN